MACAFAFGWRFCNDRWLDAGEKGVQRFCRGKYFELKEIAKVK